MSGATERDPRVSPMPSDVISGRGSDGVLRAIVVDIVKDGQVFYWQTDDEMADRTQSGSLRRVPIEHWRDGVHEAEIVHRAGDGAVEG
jgi:hypothetical protein